MIVGPGFSDIRLVEERPWGITQTSDQHPPSPPSEMIAGKHAEGLSSILFKLDLGISGQTKATTDRRKAYREPCATARTTVTLRPQNLMAAFHSEAMVLCLRLSLLNLAVCYTNWTFLSLLPFFFPLRLANELGPV